MRLRTLRGLVPIAFLALIAIAAPAPALAAPATTSNLFVQRADTARVAKTPAGFTLTLRGLERVVRFTDRPARQAGHEAPGAFFERWERRGLAADPPNAALALAGGDVFPVTLRAPRYRAATRTVTYRVTPLRRTAAGGGLAPLRERAVRLRPGTFRRASLFIDDAPGSTLTTFAMQFTVDASARTGSDVIFQDAEIVLGSLFQYSSFDAVPFNVLQADPTTVLFQIMSPFSGTFEISGTVATNGATLSGQAQLDTGTTLTISLNDLPPTPVPDGAFSLPVPAAATG